VLECVTAGGKGDVDNWVVERMVLCRWQGSRMVELRYILWIVRGVKYFSRDYSFFPS